MMFTRKTTNGAAFSGLLLLLQLLLLTASQSLWGQTTTKYVPSNAFFVLTTNLQNLDKKVNLADLQKLDFYHEMVKSYGELGGNDEEKAYFAEMLRSPSKLGFDVLESSNFFLSKEGDDSYLTFVVKMGNRSVYENRLQQLEGEAYGPNLQQKDGYVFWADEKEAYAWNDEVIVNIWHLNLPGAAPESYGMDEDTSYEEEPSFDWDEPDTIYEEEAVEEEPVEMEESEPAVGEEEEWPAVDDSFGSEFQENKEALEKWATKIMTRSFLQPISADETYQTAALQSYDFHIWMDYSVIMDYFNPQQSMGIMGMENELQKVLGMMQGFMEIFYADTYLSMGLNFENGKMTVRSEMFFNEEMKPFYQGITDVKLNRKFLRYVKGGDDLFGYFYMNYNLKKAIEEGKGLVYKLLDATPAYGNLASDAVKIIGIFIDEDAISNLLKGDMLLAVSGMQTILVNTKTYGMDEEFNLIEKDTAMMKTMPIVTALLSYGSEKDVMKFVNLGVHSEVLKQQGRYYTMTVPGAGIEMYLALHNGTLILTNDRELVQNRLDSGYSRSQRLSKKHRKMLCENSSAMYWDIPNTLNEVGGGETGTALGIEPYINMATQEFESIDITASRKVSNSIKGSMNFNFVNKNTNSLQVFFHFINDLFLDMQGGSKT